jgi:sugar lactone lactonase YvrE
VALAYSSKSTNVLYIADTSNNQIRSLELHEQRGEVKRAAGEGRAAYKDGVAWGAIFNQPKGMVMDNSQRLYIADSANHKIRIFDTHFGQVSTLCPQIGLQSPSDVTIDTVGYLYIADTGNHRIVKLETSASCTYTVLAGSGKAGKQDGIGKEAGFHSPQALSLRDGYLYVADTGNHIIRKIDPDDRVSTIAGSGKRGSSDGQGLSAQFNAPQGIAVDSEHNIYVADTDNHSIRKIDINGHVSTLAGSQSIGSANASGSQAQFFHPSGLLLAHNQTTLYIADRGNHQLRKMLIPYLNKSK